MIKKFYSCVLIVVAMLIFFVISASATDTEALPKLYITTEGNASVVSKEDYIGAQVQIDDGSAMSCKIKGHGNSTWLRFPKKPYKIKLDKKTDLFGMGKSKHWLLIANYIDDSLMRNALSVELAKMFGAEYLDYVWVDVIFNGEYVGNYQLYEQAKVESGRIDIFNYEDAPEEIAKAVAKKDGLSNDDRDAIEEKLTADFSWLSDGYFVYNWHKYVISDYYKLPEEFNGGLFFELDNNFDELSRFKTNADQPINIKNPENLYTDELSMLACRNIVQNLEDAFYSADKNITLDGKNVSYTDLCDFDSLVSYFLTSELLQSEAGYRSTYFYKGIDKKIVFGPIWDFDFSSGVVSPFAPTNPEAWALPRTAWFYSIAKDPYFAVKVRELYLSKLPELTALSAKNGLISSWHKYLRQSALQNDEIWPYSRGFDADTDVLKKWLNERLNWVSKQFADDRTAVSSFGATVTQSLELSLKNTSISNSDSYLLEKDTPENITLCVNAPSDWSTANCYINGAFVGEISLENGKAEYVITKELLTEETGSKNVIVVRNKADLNQMSFITFTIMPDDTEFCALTLFDGEDVQSAEVPNGSQIFLGKSSLNNNDTIVTGWNDGFNTIKEDSMYTVNGNVRITSVLQKCKSGYTHKLVPFENGSYCSLCGNEKLDESNLIPIYACIFTPDIKYANVFTGSHLAPNIQVKYHDTVLQEGRDYEIEYRNDVNVGFATYTITGIPSAGYRGQTSLTYGISKGNISKATVNIPSVYYDGDAKEPEMTVNYNGILLEKDKDYTVSFTNNVLPGKATAVLTGTGNLQGTKTVTFDIKYQVQSVSGFTVKADGSKRAVLSWNALSDADSYIILRKSEKESQYTEIAELYGNNRTRFIDDGITTAIKYSYKVKASKTVNNLVFRSPACSAKSVTTVFDASVLSVSSQGATSLKLSWAKLDGAKYYKLEQSTDGKAWKVVITTDKTSYTVSKLKAGTKYQFRVTALDSAKKVAGKVSAVLKTQTLCSAPSVKLASTKSKTATVTITKVTGASKYTVYKSTDNKKWTKVGDTTKLSYELTKLSGGKKLYVKVASVNGDGKASAYSAVKSVTVKK